MSPAANAGHKTMAIAGLCVLGAGVLFLMAFIVASDGTLDASDGGWLATAFMSLREVYAKIEAVVLGRQAQP